MELARTEDEKERVEPQQVLTILRTLKARAQDRDQRQDRINKEVATRGRNPSLVCRQGTQTQTKILIGRGHTE